MMTLTCLFVDVKILAADLCVFTAMILVISNELYAAMAVLVVIQIHNNANRQSSFLLLNGQLW